VIHVGTSGWSYPTGKGTWNGVFYPAPRPRKFDELAFYAEHFDTVEINSTFYRMPEPAMAQSWVRRTPADFLFAVKLFQKFTHPDLYLAREGVTEWDLSRADIDLFRRGVDPIVSAGKLAAVLVQFPPSFHAMPESRAYLEWLLGAFAEWTLAVEFRHRSWHDDVAATAALLQAHGAIGVVTDAPRRSGVLSSDFGGSLMYVRLHGRNAARWWDHDESEDRYDYLYSTRELKPFAEQARRAADARRRVVLYMNNHFSAKAVANAAILKSQLGQLVPGDYPVEMTRRYPELDGIVTTAGLRFESS
jgi:uncharacterized protein YecE (DUF72 family)